MSDVIHTVSRDEINFSPEKLCLFQNETLNDRDLYKVYQYYQNGWPSNPKELEGEIAHFFKLKSEITFDNGLMYYNEKLLVPKICRSFLLGLAHETHLGYEKIKDKLSNLFYWPGLKSDLLNLIQSCKVCQTFQKSKVKEKLVSHSIPDVPFFKIGMDFAEFWGKNYLVVIDYYSRWLEVFQVNNKDSEVVIKYCKELFAKFGVPSEVIADNNPFGSYSFKKFAEKWGFKVTNSSPHYPQSNGVAEKGVGIFKGMMRKCIEDQGDFNLYLLNYRNSPVAGLNYSPAQLMFCKNLRTKFPITHEMLKPQVPENTKEQKLIGQKKQANYYNKSCLTNEVEFSANEKVLVQNIFNKRWEKGVIIEKLNYPRSYLVRMDSNHNTLRRNTKFIKKFNVGKYNDFHHHIHHSNKNIEGDGKQYVTPPDVQGNEDDNFIQDHESIQDNEFIQDSELTSQNLENINSHKRTRSGRIVKPRQRLSL